MKAWIFSSTAAPASPTSPPTALRQARQNRHAFSLVESVLSLGIIAFAFVGVFSLLPAGLGVFRQAMDTSIGAQIAQRLVSEVEQSDFDSLVPEFGNAIEGVDVGGPSDQFYSLPLRYFDDQGAELGVDSTGASLPALTAADRARVVYTARIRGSLPGAADPGTHDDDYFTSLPASAAAGTESAPRFNPRSLTFLTIQVINNPGNLDLKALVDDSSYLVNPALAQQRSLSVRSFPAIVARNAYRNAN